MFLDILLITNSSVPVYFGCASLKPNPIKILIWRKSFEIVFAWSFFSTERVTPFPHYDIDQSKNKYVH